MSSKIGDLATGILVKRPHSLQCDATIHYKQKKLSCWGFEQDCESLTVENVDQTATAWEPGAQAQGVQV